MKRNFLWKTSHTRAIVDFSLTFFTMETKFLKLDLFYFQKNQETQQGEVDSFGERLQRLSTRRAETRSSSIHRWDHIR